MTIDLPEKWAEFVRRKVKSGQYGTQQQVMEAALAKMELAEEIDWPEPEELRRLAMEGNADIEAGRVTDGHEAIQRLRSRLEQIKNVRP